MGQRPTGRKEAGEPSGATVVQVPMHEAPDVLSDLVTRARISGQHTLLLRYGKEVAAIVPIELYRRLNELKMTA